jgi:hypothetical protein
MGRLTSLAPLDIAWAEPLLHLTLEKELSLLCGSIWIYPGKWLRVSLPPIVAWRPLSCYES